MVGWQKNPVRAGRRTGPVHDLAWLAASYEIDPVEPGAASFLSSRASAVSPPPAASGTGDTSKLRGSTVEHCVVTKDFAERVGLGPDVVGSLVQLFERWDGRGRPHRLAGESIALPARVVQFADVVVPFHRAGGVEAAVAMARQRKGLSSIQASWTCSVGTRRGSSPRWRSATVGMR
jgi:hypothetical protein